MFKKIFSAIMTVVLVVGLLPTVALANESSTADNGTGVAAVETSTEDVSATSSCDVPESISSFAAPLVDDDIASGTLGTCTWVIDSERCLTIAPADGVSGEFEIPSPSYNSWPWYDYQGSITSAKVESGVSATGSLAYMFFSCYALTSLDLSNFDTSNVTSMNKMFGGSYYAGLSSCVSLTSIDLSSFDTSNVTDMSSMFYRCSSLTSLDVSNFDTSNVTDMSDMFASCSSLVSLDLIGFDTSNVTDMSGMFVSCSSLTSLDLSGFNTSNVTEMRDMFAGCTSLTSLDVSNFDTSNVTNMVEMFFGCKFTSLDVSNWDTSNVLYMHSMFRSCLSLVSLDLSDWDTSNVEYMDMMFDDCTSLTSLNLSGFDTSKVITMYEMFDLCPSLTSIKGLSNFDTSNVTSMVQMFDDCSSLTSLDLSNFDTSNVKYMRFMFYGCESLTFLDMSGWDTSSVIQTSNMFYNCTGLRTVVVGEKFALSSYLPAPENYGVKGKWRDSNGTIYDNPTQLPSNVATTYTAVFPESKTTLETAIKTAEALKSSNYTSESWAAMEAALSVAIDVLADVYATQDEIDLATDTLNDAISSLVKTTRTMSIYAGEDRYATSQYITRAIANESGYGSYEGVIVCSAQNGKFADALCASGLSGLLGYPIVLVDGSYEPEPNTRTNYPDPSPGPYSAIYYLVGYEGDIIILGGESTVNDYVTNEITDWYSDGEVTRIAGDDRYATAEAVYEYGETHGGWSTDYAVVAKGNDFPDALGAASFCTTNAVPMLLADQNDVLLPSYVLDAATQTSQVVIVGGTSSVSAEKGDVLKTYTSVKRIGGSTRYSTNYSFVTWELDHGMKIGTVGVATGENFPDALGSSCLLSLTSSVLLLTSKTESENASLYNLLADNAQSISNISVFGGDASVTPDTRTAIQTAIGGEWQTVNK